jgi:hypothetical protein
LIEIVRVEKDPELKAEAIQKLGLTGQAKSGEFLVSLYKTETDPEIKEAILQALFVQNNAKAIVAIARTEKNRELKAEAVQKLSHMRAPEAREFLREILEK